MDPMISLGQKNTLAEYMILFGADNRPPMLDKDLYDSWKIEENGVTRTKKYAELSAAEKIQANCDMKATNIILQGLPADIYSLMNHHRVSKDLWERVQLLMQGTSLTKQERECSLLPIISSELLLIQETKPLFKMAGLPCNKFREDKGKIILPKRQQNAAWYKEKAMLAEAQEAGQILDEEQLAFLAEPGIPASQVQTVIPHNVAFQTEDLDTYDSDCDDLSTAQAVLMANISNYGPYIVSENNESITAELERYKERVKTFEQRLNVNLSSREKMIDSQIDDMIREKCALKEQIDSLEQNLSKQIKEKESVLQTFSVFKNESKEKEKKYMENEIDLENKIKELDNIVYKVGQSAQTVHMKAQRIKPTLYDGTIISKTHVVMPVIDDEETLILEEESRSKMIEKAKDPKTIKQNISQKPIDYEMINRLIEDFGKRFTPQQELSAEQAFWLRISNPSIEPSYTPPVIVDVPSKLPEVSLVNESLKKLKFHLTQFDSVVKKRTTPSALEEGEWGFEHTKAVFNKEIIPFLKSLKDIFNVFDKDLLNKITEVQTVFDQMEMVVQQFSVDKQCLKIVEKQNLLEIDRLLHKIVSQDVLLTVMNFMPLNNDSMNTEMYMCDSCEK
ncbi:hypothetical protein Tco_0091093 [Tanacetum coccineum]